LVISGARANAGNVTTLLCCIAPPFEGQQRHDLLLFTAALEIGNARLEFFEPLFKFIDPRREIIVTLLKVRFASVEACIELVVNLVEIINDQIIHFDRFRARDGLGPPIPSFIIEAGVGSAIALCQPLPHANLFGIKRGLTLLALLLLPLPTLVLKLPEIVITLGCVGFRNYSANEIIHGVTNSRR
jgi:hypothetical protein